MINILKAIVELKSDAQVSIEDNDVTKITWHDDNPTNITNEQILAKQVELQTAYDNAEYQRNRVYPKIGEQLDMQYKDLLNGTTTWKDAVAKVKSDNPKG